MATIQTQYQVNGLNPSSVGGSGTGIKYFPNQPGPSIGVANLTPSATSSKGQLLVPGSGRLNGQAFAVTAVGYINTDPTIACPSVTVSIAANTAAVGVSPTYTILGTTGVTVAGNFDAEPFAIKLSLFGDTDTGIVYGTQAAFYNGTLKSSGSSPNLTNNLSGINMSTEPPFGLVCSVTFSVSGPANIAYLTQFSLES